MSQAKVHRAAKARKEWACGKCGATIKAGEPVLSFSVGFRGREQRRCDKPRCYPTRAERESSMTAPIYDAIDSAELKTATTLDDVQETLDGVADTLDEVISDYEASEMYERSEDLQERVDMLSEAAGVLEAWEPDEEAPDEDDPATWGEQTSYQAAYDLWLQDVVDGAQEVLYSLDLP